jgi:hypothetical protein
MSQHLFQWMRRSFLSVGVGLFLSFVPLAFGMFNGGGDDDDDDFERTPTGGIVFRGGGDPEPTPVQPPPTQPSSGGVSYGSSTQPNAGTAALWHSGLQTRRQTAVPYSVVQASDMSRQFAEARAIREEQARQLTQAQEELRACQERWRKGTQNSEKFRDQLRAIRESISAKMSRFDKIGALNLRAALAKWDPGHSTEAMGDIACSADRLTGEIEEFLDQVKRVPRERTSVIAGGLAGESYREGMSHLTQAAEAVVQNPTQGQSELQISEGYREAGKILLDLATAVTPGVSVGRDAYEAITGHSLIDGRELEAYERALAIVGVTTLGAGGLVRGGIKVVEELNAVARARNWIRTSEQAMQEAVRAGHEIVESTGTVWSSIRATQPAYHGSIIPKSFELTANTGNFWVHGNATEHIAEYAAARAINGTPEAVRLASQVQVASLKAAVETATIKGVKFGEMIKVGGWELRFEPARQSDHFPVLVHALYK